MARDARHTCKQPEPRVNTNPMQPPTCRVCGIKHWGGEHVFPQSPLCQKCGEQTGVDRTGKARWCKCVRDTAAAADQIIRKVMGKPLNGNHAPSQPTIDVLPGKTARVATPSNTGKDESAARSLPEKDIVVDNTASLPVVDAAKDQLSTDSDHRKKYMQQYMKDRRQRERDEKQRATKEKV